MPDRGTLVPVETETRFGTRTVTPAGQVVFMLDAPAGKVSVLALQDTAGVTWYLWVDTAGAVRASITEPTLPNADGTVVGP